ncbi:MAG: serine hydrolase [Gemmatimonadales bacterium]|nr:serine hydrolase [Gemmatimonadales bacterium]
MAVLFAVQDGLLDLDTPISEYLPAFRINSRFEEHPERIITLRHLLSHRSGIVHDAPFGNNTDLEYGFEPHIESLSDSWLQFPVGYCYSYSNGGIDLAGYLLQEVTGVPFARYLREVVLAQLGMMQSSADFDAIEPATDRARGHWRRPDPLPLRFSMIPAGGLYSSIEDMAKYVMFHVNMGRVDGKQVLRKDLMREFHSIQFALPGQRFGYALGLIRNGFVTPYGVMHAGGGYGFFGWMAAYPGLKFGVIFLSNAQARNLSADSFRFIDETIIRRRGLQLTAPPPRSSMTALDGEDPRVQYRIGRYGPRSPEIRRNGTGGTVEIGIYGAAYPIEFFEHDGRMIGLFGDNMAVEFLPDFGDQRGAMMVYSLPHGNSNWNYYFFNDSPYDEYGPDRPEWAEYLGEYESHYHGRLLFTGTVHRRNGNLYWGEQKLTEHARGLFFTYDGWEVNFNEEPARIGHYRLRRVRGN